MKTIRNISCLVGMLLAALLFSAHAMEAERDYASYVEQLKSGDTAIDYLIFRQAYAETPGFNPYLGADIGDLYEALNNSDFTTAVAEAEKILAVNYTNLDAHFVAYISHDELGNADAATFHDTVARGLHASIRDTGDGASPETAYDVISVEEEYAFLRLRGLRVLNQALVAGPTPTDALTVEDMQTGETLPAVYFDVSQIMMRFMEEIDNPGEDTP